MKPIPFKKQNIEIAKDQDEYLTLPARILQNREQEVVSCWKLSWRELLNLIFTRRIWLSCWTFGNPLQPIRMEVVPDKEWVS